MEGFKEGDYVKVLEGTHSGTIRKVKHSTMTDINCKICSLVRTISIKEINGGKCYNPDELEKVSEEEAILYSI